MASELVSSSAEAAAPVADCIVIIGAGVGGCAAALALQRAGRHVKVFEKDAGPDVRRQGYGMTLQTSPALRELGVLDDIVACNTVSMSHFMFAPDGAVVGYFGDPIKPMADATPDPSLPRRPGGVPFNVRIPRDVLRGILLSRLLPGTVQWGRRLVGFECLPDGQGVDVSLERCGPAPADSCPAALEVIRASVLVGADGVRSRVRQCMAAAPPPLGLPLGALPPPGGLRYMGVVLMLGVSRMPQPCPPLLDRQGFYTLDGRARLFTMPYAQERGGGPTTLTMWQLSFAEGDEAAAAAIAALPPAALVALAQRMCSSWHEPVGALLAASEPDVTWATLLCDHGETSREDAGHPPGKLRAGSEALRRWVTGAGRSPPLGCVTLIGDAAHPMSPFKGQGANQALRDAPALAAALSRASAEDPRRRAAQVRRSTMAVRGVPPPCHVFRCTPAPSFSPMLPADRVCFDAV